MCFMSSLVRPHATVSCSLPLSRSDVFGEITRSHLCVPEMIPVLSSRFKFDGGTPVASKRLTAQKRVTPLNLLTDPSAWVDQGPGQYPTFKGEMRLGTTVTHQPPCCCHYHRRYGTAFGGGEMHVETHEKRLQSVEKIQLWRKLPIHHFAFGSRYRRGGPTRERDARNPLRLVHKPVTDNVNDDLSCELLARPLLQFFSKG